MEYVVQDCQVLDFLAQAQSGGGHPKITLHAKLSQKFSFAEKNHHNGFQWNKTFRCLFPTLKETKYKKSKHSKFGVAFKNEIDLEEMLSD